MPIKVSSPEDMRLSLEESRLLEMFEDKFSIEEKGNHYYHLVILGEYPRYLLDQVQETYIAAGWLNVKCTTSSESGERPGLTGLQLYTNEGISKSK